jgi:hypothetical protein
MSSLFQDARLAIRNLRKSPGLVAAVVFSLAIGIGANTTVYSAIDALRSQELPFAEPERLVVLWRSSRGGLGVPSYQVAAEVARKAAAVESVGFTLSGESPVTLSEPGEPARTLPMEAVDLGALRMLGTAPVLGRLYSPENRGDMVLQKESRSIVIGYRLWQQRFGGSPKALSDGRSGSAAMSGLSSA